MERFKGKHIKYILAIITLIIIFAVVSSFANVNNESRGLTGTIEVKEVNVASKLPGRVVKLYVSQNQSVKAGDIIAQISSDELKAKEEQAKALVNAAKSQLDQAKDAVKLQEIMAKSNAAKASSALSAANAQYDKAKNGARNEEIAQAKISYDFLLKTYGKVKALQESGAVSEQKLEEIKAQLDVAKERLDIAKNAVRSEDIQTAKAMVDQAKATVDAANTSNLQVELAKQNIIAAQAKYDQAKAGLEEVRAYLKDTNIISPINGTVTILNPKEGELIGTGTLVAVVSDLSDMWVNVKVLETKLSKVQMGNKYKVNTVMYPNNSFYGVVSSIDKKPDFAAKRSTNERDEKDIFSFNVKVKIDNTKGMLRPGITAYVDM